MADENIEAVAVEESEPKKKAVKKIKCKVSRPFKDVYTKEVHNAGDVMAITEARFKEINKNKAFVKKI